MGGAKVSREMMEKAREFAERVKKIDKLIVVFGDEIEGSKRGKIVQYVKEGLDPRITRIKLEEGDAFTIFFLKQMRAVTKAQIILRVNNTLSELDDYTSFQTVAPRGARSIKVIKRRENLSKRVAQIDPKKCIGCQECVTACQESAIQNWEEKIFVVPEMCTNCKEKHCVKACRFNAIRFVKRKKQSRP